MRNRVLIVGGGSAGITVAALLRRKGISDIAILEPSETHYYQPAWTLVGGGVIPREKTARETGKLIPAGVNWVRDRAKSFDPVAGHVDTEQSGSLGYDFLVVAPGLQLDWQAIPGLEQALATPHVSSIYSYEGSTKTWEMLRGVQQGRAVFTCPP
ncbi:MAG: NAD(P)/FAD-dependent oxidoreductase, partial [Myxococcales bacterium]|nr:NAD(P)/FAD-dependent oxidoreductase [Myxococcales bacterium]